MLLFLIPALLRGSTWLAIRYQLGVVDPVVSVAYRFLAGRGFTGSVINKAIAHI